MAVLGFIEAALSFAVIYAAIQFAGASAPVPPWMPTLARDGTALALVLTVALGAVALTIGLYRPTVCFNRNRLLAATVLPAAIAFAMLVIPRGSLRDDLTTDALVANAAFAGTVIGAWLSTIAMIRLVFGFALGRVAAPRRILIVGDARGTSHVIAQLNSRRGRRFDPLMRQAAEVSWDTMRGHQVWGVVLASQPDAATLAALVDCKLRGVRVLWPGTFQEQQLGRIDLDALTAEALLMAPGYVGGRIAAALKRTCDVVISIAMVFMTLPLMVLTALAIKADSAGPVLYRQQRIGAFGRPFTVLKFRSMTTDAEAGGCPRWAQQHDPRVTKVGRVIRATRIDELPQLVNVIIGEMSLVGPRPERPHFVEQLAHAIPFYRQRSYVKPGLTGWAQVNYPYGASVEDAREKLAYDLYYVKNRSLWLDIRILLATVRVVLFREGAR
jgi:exopolysaccharide biosynthesis polyprenyl glycosylphosphotransferase